MSIPTSDDTLVSKKITEIFISYHRNDEYFLERLKKSLAFLEHRGSIKIWDYQQILPGDDWKTEIDRHLNSADIILLLVSPDFLASEYCFHIEMQRAMERHELKEARVIPIYSRPANFQDAPFSKLQALPSNLAAISEWKRSDEAFQDVVKGICRAIGEEYIVGMTKEPWSGSNLIITKVEIFNIRCFENTSISLSPENQGLSYFAMLLGDNAIGKSTILKSIALGLCNESDAAALIKASEMQGDFIRKGATEGCIKITLCRDSKAKRPKKYTITTRITKKSEDAPEIVRQETQPAENFPWADIFVCGYGAYRSKQADTSYEQYKAIDAVKSLFDHQTSLQNPELILLRQDPQIRTILEEKLRNILMLDTPDHTIHYTKRGLEIEGPWGRMPFQTLSDGYRSTTIWVLDFIGWLIHAERLLGNPDIGGILIIDEIEQHLHPRWQRYIVQRLRQQFPKTQIIASTHTPLVAAGIADVDQSMLLKLERNEENEISLKIIDKEQVAGKRADQVLTSDAFGLYTTRNERSHDDVDRYNKLLSKDPRTENEEAELEQLRSIIQDRFNNGETYTEQLVEKLVEEALQGIITNVPPEMLSVETKKQLQELFRPEN